MIECLKDRRVSFLIASLVAGIFVKILAHGNSCSVPSSSLKQGEMGIAETSIHGVVLYRETGTDHKGLYDQSVWYLQMLLLAEWVGAVGVGAVVYAVLRRAFTSPQKVSINESS